MSEEINLNNPLIQKSDFDALSIQLALGNISVQEWQKQLTPLAYNIQKYGTPEAIEEAYALEAILGHGTVCVDKDFVLDEIRKRVNYTNDGGCEVAYALSKETKGDD